VKKRFEHPGPRYYILKGHKAVVADLMTWARWVETADRHIKFSQLKNCSVSTVFLGLDHSFRLSGDEAGPPILFETMIFGGPEDGFTDRCATWEQAEAMHAAALALVTKLRRVK
jgi:hypothetical protein